MSVVDLSPMKQTMTIGMLPQSKFSYSTLFVSLALHIVFVIGLVHFGVIKLARVVVAARRLVYTPLVSTEASFARPQPTIKAYEPPVVGDLVIPKLPAVSRPALVEPPKLKIKAEVRYRQGFQYGFKYLHVTEQQVELIRRITRDLRLAL